jgi:tetratricopeptide (TPR) repeat protein
MIIPLSPQVGRKDIFPKQIHANSRAKFNFSAQANKVVDTQPKIKNIDQDFIKFSPILFKEKDLDRNKVNELNQIPLPLESVYSAIKVIKNIDEAVELVLFSLKNYKENIPALKNIMDQLFNNYDKDQVAKHQSLAKLEICNLGNNKMQYSLDDNSYYCECRPTKPPINDLQAETFLKIHAQMCAMIAAVRNKHYVSAGTLLKKVMKFADQDLNILKGHELYHQAISKTTVILKCLQDTDYLEVMTTLKAHMVKHYDALSDISNKLLENNRYHEAIEWLEPNISEVKDNYNNTSLAYCRYNLGMAYLNNNCFEEALKYFQESHKGLPNDSDVIVKLITVYAHLDRASEMNKLISNVQNITLKKLFTLMTYPDTISGKPFSMTEINALPKTLQPYVNVFNIIGNFNDQTRNHIKIDVGSFKTRIRKLKEHGVNDSTIITAALQLGFHDIAQEFIDKIPKEEIYSSPRFQRIKALLASKEASASSWINDISIGNQQKAELFAAAGNAAIANGDYALALSNAEEGLSLDQSNKDLAEVGLTAALMSNDTKKAEIFIPLLAKDQQCDIAEAYSIDGTEDINAMLKQYDPIQIHKDCQLKKQQDLSKASSAISIMVGSAASWQPPSCQKITPETATYIGKYRGLDCWAHIPGKIQSEVNGNLSRFKRALGKGITTRDKSQNGVKFLGRKGVEIKINADQRLHTNKIHVNKKGQLLIIFDEIDNHAGVATAASNGRLTYVDV